MSVYRHSEIVKACREILWPNGEQGHEWGADQLEALAGALSLSTLDGQGRPRGREDHPRIKKQLGGTGQPCEESLPHLLYLLEIQGDVEPVLHGPFITTEERDQLSHELRRDDPDLENGLYLITAQGPLDVMTYGGLPEQNEEENES